MGHELRTNKPSPTSGGHAGHDVTYEETGFVDRLRSKKRAVNVSTTLQPK